MSPSEPHAYGMFDLKLDETRYVGGYEVKNHKLPPPRTRLAPRVSREWLADAIECGIADGSAYQGIEEIVRQAVRAELRAMLPEIISALKGLN